ncbi:hypothetical protein M9Y10_003805 [Tritrichomonas musculus]|uniref:Uncharacterized protein n=1 Tax=Tritrichomonas musculus TaxID=1915356 RepID=A0ABR2JQB0_9EUKA
MENEFLRNSWNIRLSKDDFLLQAKEKFDDKSIKILISLLENICAFDDSSPLFIEYFGSIVNEYFVFSLGNVDFFNENQINSYFRLFINYNCELFGKCKIGQKEDAHAALNAFRICLIQNQKLITPLLTKLFQQPNFLVLLASSRSLDTDYFTFVRKLYKEISPFEKYPIAYPLLNESFRRAFVDDKGPAVQISIMDMNECLSFLSVFLHIFLLYDFFPKILDRKAHITIFSILLDQYYQNAHILHGNAIHKVLNLICEPVNGQITKSNLQEIINNEYYRDNQMGVPFSTDVDQLYTYLFVPNENFDSDHFTSNFLTTPALCLHFSDMLIEKIPNGSIEFYHDITENLDTYICLYSERKGVVVLKALISHLQTIRDSVYYDAVFTYFCSFFTFYYNMFENEEIIDFMERQTSEVRDMMKLIVCLEIEQKRKSFPMPIFTKANGLPVPRIDTSTPFEKCIKFASLVGQMCGDEVLEYINKEPYLFIIALSEGLRNRRKDFNILTKHKFSEVYSFHNRLSQMLLVTNRPENPQWNYFTEDIFVGYDFMRAFPPKSVEDIEEYLLRDVYYFFKVSNLSAQEIIKICIHWNFYFRHFGTKEVMDKMFSYLWKKETDSLINQFVYYLCISGVVMTIASRKSGFGVEFLQSIIMLFKENRQINQEMATRLFSFVFLSLNDEDSNMIMKNVSELKDKMLNEGEDTEGCQYARFISTFFRFMMFLPKMFNNMKEDIFKVFMKIGDSQSLIDYFVLVCKNLEI